MEALQHRPTVIASSAAAEVGKILLHKGKPRRNRVLTVDLLHSPADNVLDASELKTLRKNGADEEHEHET